MDYLTAAVIDRSRMMQEWVVANAKLPASAYWDELNADNIAAISQNGIQNFKKTLAQNYFNFIIANISEGQFQAALRAWVAEADDIPLSVESKGHWELELRNNPVVATPLQQRVYTFFVGLLWSLAVKGDATGIAARLSEPTLGNPIDIRLPDDRLVSQDLANSLREYNRVGAYLKPTDGRLPVLAEIGAGYGRVGWVAMQTEQCRYWVFDIPPALAVSEFYLSQTYPDKKVFRWRPFTNWSEVAEEVASADIAFFSSDQLELVPDRSVSAFVAISCLHEMKPEQFTKAMSLMSSKASNAIYTKNWTGYTVPTDNFVFTSDMLVADAGWTTAYSRTDEILLDMTEKLFLR